MAKIFSTEYVIMDVNKGSPIHKSRTRINFKALAKRIAIIALVAIIAFFAVGAIYSYASAPVLRVSCSEASNCLIFRDENQTIVGYLRSASPEQLEEIKRIQKIIVDPSVDDFTPAADDAEYFELYILGFGHICFNSDECDFIPYEYNYTLTDNEHDEVIELMDEVHKFLYEQLDYIIC